MADDAEAAPTPKWEGPVDEAGLPHGTGLMTYPPPPLPEEDEEQQEEEPKPGDTYQGPMVHGKRHGHGKYTWGAQGAVYDGEYVDNRRQGLGVMTFPDKSRYEGSFSEDEGQGTYYYSNGNIYTGGMRAGKKHGSGQLFFKEQSCMFVGVWADGEFMEGKWVQQDGTTFKGSFAASVPKTGTFSFTHSGLSAAGSYSTSTGWSAEEVGGVV